MKEIIFKDVKIQKGHRINIPKALVDSLDIKEGDKITLKFDVSGETLTVEFAK